MNRVILTATCSLGMLASSAVADVTAEVIPDGTGGTVDVDFVSGKWEVVFDRSDISGDVELWVYGEETDTIRFIEIESGATSSADTEIYVRGDDPLDRVGAVERIEEMSGIGETQILELRVLNDLGDGSNDEDCIVVDRIFSADIGDDVTDAVTTSGSIDDFLVGDDFLGDLTIDNGTLFKLDVSGSIGSVGTPVTIDAGSAIEDLEAADINAHITVHTIKRLVATTGDLTGSINATTTGEGAAVESITVEDDMTASLTLSGSLTIPLLIKGDAIGDIAVNDLSVTGGYSGTITIGDKLIGDLIIGDDDGIDEQVIFNANNNVYGNWLDAWAGDVTLDGVALTKGAYPDTDIGGEAVGLARFTCHLEECIPPDGTVYHNGQQPPNNRIELWHYGPVAPFYTGSGYTDYPMVKVERQNISGGSWTNVTANFDSDFNVNEPRLLRVVPESGDWGSNYNYKLTHVVGGGLAVPPSGYLVCDDLLTVTAPSLLAYTYEFTIDAD